MVYLTDYYICIIDKVIHIYTLDLLDNIVYTIIMTPKETKQKELNTIKSLIQAYNSIESIGRELLDTAQGKLSDLTLEESELEKDLAVIEMREDEESELTPDIDLVQPESRFDGILEKGDDGRSLHQMKMDDINKLDNQ